MESVSEDRESLREFLEEAELLQYHELFRDILKVTKISQLKFVATEDLAHIGLSKPEQRRYKKIYTKYFPNPYISKIKKLLTSNKKNDLYGNCPGSIPIDFQPFTENNVKVPTKHIIPVEDITINKELGMGQFGVVQQGTWTTGNQRLQVAIKCLGNERMTSNSNEFLKEAAVMHSIEHPNIVRLYGVVLHMDSLMLVTELAPLRSLLECLREVSLRSSFPVPTLCEFAEQICDGMTYLENKRLIHRDLAARNILVFSKDRVKISDFGLSRALGVGKDYYQTNYNVNLKLPVAWCAPECILYLRFTSSSDVWAFGVCLWEMFTYGFQPWAAFSGQQILEAIDAPNYQRLERPDCCPEHYYAAMCECWSHEPNDRPKFKDLVPKLRDIRPEQVQTTINFQKPEEARRNNLLEYKSGQIITVIGKENMTKSPMWYGVMAGGACGVFDPANTKPYVKTPPPRQVVTPYKPSEDLEQMPLINPNSPSHLTGDASMPPYPLLTHDAGAVTSAGTGVEGVTGDAKSRNSLKKPTLKPLLAPTTSKSILNKVKSATLGRSFKNCDVAGTSKDEIHEYHEISDTDTDSNATDIKTDNLVLPESPSIPKSYGDFSQSLLEEMESMFRNLDGPRPPAGDDQATASRYEVDNVRSYTLDKPEKKKSFHSGTMKPMSAHEQKTLDTAVAMANEITTRSMNDLGTESQRAPHSPSDRGKFHFKFPLVAALHHSAADIDNKDANGKQERRNFSEEANSVPDIQATLTEESKLAYASLIEQPTPAATLISHIASAAKHATIPKTSQTKPTLVNSLRKPARSNATTNNDLCESLPISNANNCHADEVINELPLPPRATKPKLVDKPRHIRKYPLVLPNMEEQHGPSTSSQHNRHSNIYQNFVSCQMEVAKAEHCNDKVQYQNLNANGIDMIDGATNEKNPFKNGTNIANPFEVDDVKEGEPGEEDEVACSSEQQYYNKEPTLVKDHVSVEDLLEFADQKPCGRQRGAESDEVRIMCKVLKQQVTPEQCLESLELCEWSVHLAIKVMRVRLATARDAPLECCARALSEAAGDVVKAAARLPQNIQ